VGRLAVVAAIDDGHREGNGLLGAGVEGSVVVEDVLEGQIGLEGDGSMGHRPLDVEDLPEAVGEDLQAVSAAFGGGFEGVDGATGMATCSRLVASADVRFRADTRGNPSRTTPFPGVTRGDLPPPAPWWR
jgi:hypothetical protein